MNRLLLQSAAVLALTGAALANAPQSVAPPAPAQGQPRIERAAYMGIATATEPVALREQLKLPRGVGLVIEFVDKDSPADRAGLQPHDVIHKFNDQLIINAAQLTVLVRLCKPGDVARLTIVRRGAAEEVDVALGERDLPVFDEPTTLMITPEHHSGGPLPRPGAGGVSGVITHSDGVHTITINSHDNSRDVVIKDRDDNVIYTGRLNTDQDREQIPPELREKVAQVEKSTEKLNDLRRGLRNAPPEDAGR